MEQGLVDDCGYPVGDLYVLSDFEFKKRGIQKTAMDFQNNRRTFHDVGVPVCRIPSVTIKILTTSYRGAQMGFLSDFEKGLDLPEKLI